MPTDFFASNGWQEVDDGHLDQMYDNPKNPAVITLDRCDIKPVSLLNIFQKTKALKNVPTVLLDMGERYNCVRVESSHLGNIWRQHDTFISTPNG